MRVFDFDNTIYDGESVIDFYLFSLRRNPKVARYVPVVLYHLLRYKLGRTTMADLEQAGRKHAAQYLSSFDDPEGLVRDFSGRAYTQDQSLVSPGKGRCDRHRLAEFDYGRGVPPPWGAALYLLRGGPPNPDGGVYQLQRQ